MMKKENKKTNIPKAIGKDFNYEDEWKWWEKKRLEVTKSMHPATIIFCNTVFDRLAKGYSVTKELMRLWYDESYFAWKKEEENLNNKL